MEDTPTTARVNGWSNRATWLFALEYASIWDVPALLTICRTVEDTAASLKESAWATLIPHGQYTVDGHKIVRTAEILRDVDWVEIVETFTEDEE